MWEMLKAKRISALLILGEWDNLVGVSYAATGLFA